MHYWLCASIECDSSMIERHSGCNIAYCSKRKLEQLHPDGDYIVIGEIGNYARRYAEQDAIDIDAGQRIPVFPLGSYRRMLEWVAGYAPLGGAIYVAVVKGLIPGHPPACSRH